MNERFKELLYEAANYAMKNTKFHSHYEREEWEEDVANMIREKFAEAIVRKCCEVINAAKPGVVQVPAEVALDMTSKNVKAYFGVKE
jgi:hypothetical protein